MTTSVEQVAAAARRHLRDALAAFDIDPSQVTEAEIARRALAAINAKASTEMEGLAVGTEAQADLREWILGKMTIEEAIVKAVERHTRR